MVSAEGNRYRIAVWWDFENCSVPNGTDSFRIVDHIRQALSTIDLNGSIIVSAFGDIRNLAPSVSESLTSTGVSLHHIPSVRKENTDKAILVNLFLWTLDNPPPANIFLISGDRDFSNALHGLRMRGYNILLAYPDGREVLQSLISSASATWHWSTLVKGECIHPLPSPPSAPSKSRQKWIREVLQLLKKERLCPTESNMSAILDLIDSPIHPVVDFAALLQQAVASGDLCYRSVGEKLLLLPPEMPDCWDYVDWDLCQDFHSANVWKAFEKLLRNCGEELMECKSRFEIASQLRANGGSEFHFLPLAEIINLLQLAEEKGWIKRHSRARYGPIRITMPIFPSPFLSPKPLSFRRPFPHVSPPCFPHSPPKTNQGLSVTKEANPSPSQPNPASSKPEKPVLVGTNPIPNLPSKQNKKADQTSKATAASGSASDLVSQVNSVNADKVNLIDADKVKVGCSPAEAALTADRVRECLVRFISESEFTDGVSLPVAKSQMEKWLGQSIEYKPHGHSNFTSFMNSEFSDIVTVRMNCLYLVKPTSKACKLGSESAKTVLAVMVEGSAKDNEKPVMDFAGLEKIKRALLDLILLKPCINGSNLSVVKIMIEEEMGKEIDLISLGFSKFSNLLKSFDDVVEIKDNHLLVKKDYNWMSLLKREKNKENEEDGMKVRLSMQSSSSSLTSSSSSLSTSSLPSSSIPIPFSLSKVNSFQDLFQKKPTDLIKKVNFVLIDYVPSYHQQRFISEFIRSYLIENYKKRKTMSIDENRRPFLNKTEKLLLIAGTNFDKKSFFSRNPATNSLSFVSNSLTKFASMIKRIKWR